MASHGRAAAAPGSEDPVATPRAHGGVCKGGAPSAYQAGGSRHRAEAAPGSPTPLHLNIRRRSSPAGEAPRSPESAGAQRAPPLLWRATSGSVGLPGAVARTVRSSCWLKALVVLRVDLRHPGDPRRLTPRSRPLEDLILVDGCPPAPGGTAIEGSSPDPQWAARGRGLRPPASNRASPGYAWITGPRRRRRAGGINPPAARRGRARCCS